MSIQTLPAADEFAHRKRVHSPAETRLLGERASGLLSGGEIVLLWGPLGAGKTCFVQGLCHGLEVAEDVTSPSFTLANRYQGRLVVHHLDFFRITPGDDLVDIGIDAVLEEVERDGAVLLVEWPAPLLPLLDARLELLVLPVPDPQQRIWYLRGVPTLPACWAGFFAGEDPRC